MMQSPKIPFSIAIIININIVIGSAFFLGAPRISALGHILAPAAWLLCGLLLTPLVIVLAGLARSFPTAGGIYVYSKERLGEVWGFLSGWGYFIGTVAGNAAVIHAFGQQLRGAPHIAAHLTTWNISNTTVDLVLIAAFTLLNLLNVTILERLQVTLTVIKSIPFILLLLAAPIMCSVPGLSDIPFNFGALFSNMPFVLFAYIGVEACCAIANQIEGGHKAGARAILTSFFIIVLIYTFFQSLLVCGGDSSINAFLNIIPRFTSNPWLIAVGNNVIYSSILASFLAGYYGMFYYNNWNLYAMAQEESIPGSQFIRRQNKNGIPWVCVLAQALLVAVTVITLRTSSALVTVGDFGVLLAYALSIASFLKAGFSLIGVGALVSCSTLMYMCAQGVWEDGLVVLLPFAVVMISGIVLFTVQRIINTNKNRV